MNLTKIREICSYIRLRVFRRPCAASSSAILALVLGVNGIAPAQTATAAPTFSPTPGTYASAQSVWISDAIVGATIYYTTNGSAPCPTCSGTGVYTAPFLVDLTTTVKAMATAPGLTNSAVVSATYTIQQVPQASAPYFNLLPSGTYTGPQLATIVGATIGSIVYYTTDGTTPTASSYVATGPVTVSSTETLNAIATAPGFSTSPVGSASYTILPTNSPHFNEDLIHIFTGGSDFATPLAPLIADSKGNLYGTAYENLEGLKTTGNGSGGVFELSPPSNGNGPWTETILYTFSGASDGGNPNGVMVLDSNGNLYGTTTHGGSNSIFCYDTGDYGSEDPYGGCGVVFELSPPSSGSGPWTETVLYTFAGGADGLDPVAGLVSDSNGNLYGTTSGMSTTCPLNGSNYTPSGCGVAFELSPPASGSVTWTETVLHTFTNGNDGGYPSSPLIVDSKGNLYGTASSGGADGAGVVFELSPTSGGNGAWTETVLHNFAGYPNDGAAPGGMGISSGILTMDANGRLFGTTEQGGNSTACSTTYGIAYGCGTAFELSSSGNGQWSEALLYQFTGANLSSPTGGVVFDAKGNLYGTAMFNATTPGADSPETGGGVFELTPPSSGAGSWSETVIQNFSGTNGGAGGDNEEGQGRLSGLLVDFKGNIYGAADPGGDLTGANCYANPEYRGCGVIYELSPTSGIASSTGLTVAPANVSEGSSNPVAITATVAPTSGSGGTPTGTVTFYIGWSPIGAVGLTAGSATLNYNSGSLPAGTNWLTAVYSGDSTFSGSTSVARSLTVCCLSAMPLPTLSLPTGTYSSSQTVTINDSFSGAGIYYTTDGSSPTTFSTYYNGPITVSSTETIKAIASANGYSNSAVASATYTIATEPAFTLANSGNITITAGNSGTSTLTVAPLNGFTGTVNFSCVVAGSPAGMTCQASPTNVAGSSAATSTLTVTTTSATQAGIYTATVTASDAATGKITASTTTTVTVNGVPSFTLGNGSNITVAAGNSGSSTLTVTPSGGFTGQVNFSCSVTNSPTGLTCSAPSANVTGASPVTSMLSVTTSSATPPAIYTATITGSSAGLSSTTSATVTVNSAQAATPIFSPTAGTYTSTLTVAINDSTTGATIYYTTNGTTPTTSSTKYTGPITVSSSETIEAIAAASGDSNSAVASAAYIINLPQTATPTFSPAAGSFTSAQTVTISDSTNGATIYYTTDGTTPTTSSTKYAGPITVSASETIEAVAVASGYTNSAIATAAYTITLPGFTLSASPATVSVVQGNNATSTITVTDVGGFSGNVALAASSLPSGVTASFAAGSATGTQVLTLTASASASTTSSPATVTITGTSGPLSATTTVAVTITAPPFGPGSGGTTSITLTPGSTTGDTGTISVAGTNGFTGTVSLVCKVATAMTNVNDMPTCSLNPGSVTLSGTTPQTSILTVNTTAASSAENRLQKLFGPISGGTALALIALFLVPRRRKTWLAMLGIFVLFLSLSAIGCGGGGGGGGGNGGSGGGGGNPGTTAGTYTITVTGTSGSVSATVGTVTLTVQ